MEKTNTIDYRKEILSLLEKISDEWVLKQIYRCIKNLLS